MSTPPPPFDPPSGDEPQPHPNFPPPPSTAGAPPPPALQPGGPQPPPPSYPPGGYPQGGYQPAPAPGGGGYRRQLEPMDAFSYGWNAFTKNVGPFLIITFITLLLSVGLSVLGAGLDGGFDLTSSEDWSRTGPFETLLNLVGSLITTFLGLGMLRMAFDVLDGRKAELGRMFSGYNVLIAFVTSIVVSLLTSVGLILCIIPGLVVAFLLLFATSRVIDSGAGVGDALTGSYELVKANVGPVLLWVLLMIVMYIAAICTCGIGLLVAMPVGALATAYVYRTISGGQVATPA